jgi:hypothetical protein
MKTDDEKELTRMDDLTPTEAPQPATPDASPPPLWQHAVTECNEAHAALDQHGAPTTRFVRRVRGPDGDQEVTVGLADRIHALAKETPEGWIQRWKDCDAERLSALRHLRSVNASLVELAGLARELDRAFTHWTPEGVGGQVINAIRSWLKGEGWDQDASRSSRMTKGTDA